MIKLRNLALFLFGISFMLELSAACSITKDLSSKKSALYLQWTGTENTASIAHILATTVLASDSFKLTSMLDGKSIYAPDSDCPSECLIELIAMESSYVSPYNHSITMAAPDHDYKFFRLLSFNNRTIQGETQRIYCAPTKGWCGATVNLYRYVSFLYNDYFLTTAIMQKDHYGLDNMGIPLCYIWDGSSTSSSMKDKLKWAGILVGIAIAILLIIGLIAFATVFFTKSASSANKVDGLYQGDSAEAPPRPVETQETHEPVHHERKKPQQQRPQQQKHFDISDPRGDVPDAYID